MKAIFYLPLFLLISLSMQAQQVTMIPDSSFERALIDKGIDSDGTVNGQLMTADAEAVTTLVIDGCEGGYRNIDIENLTGLEAFVNIDTLKINCTKVHHLPLNALSQLTYLSIGYNYIEDLDLSDNPVLEYLYIVGFSDYLPNNSIESVDLSQNPNINDIHILGYYKKEINLANGNNNSDMVLDIQTDGPSDGSWHVCIKVDDPVAAQNDAYPYSEWIIVDSGFQYTFTDDLEACTLGLDKFNKQAVKLYPNPAQEDVYLANLKTSVELQLYSLDGKLIRDQRLDPDHKRLSLSDVAPGLYIYKVIRDSRVVQTGKLVKQ